MKRIADVTWNVDPTFYVILEHFANNDEETELSDYGMMLWGNANWNYGQAAMGYSQDFNFSGVSHTSRGWSDPHLVGYMESHDEERLMYKNLNFGNSGAGYDITSLNTALERMELVGAMFFTIPGPKMLWQFGEVGYDVSIDFDCRVCPKPIRWNYYGEYSRQKLYKIWAALINLRTTEVAFRTTNFNLNLGGIVKTIHLNDPTMNVTVIGNFDVSQRSGDPDFQSTGWWYDYLSGDSIFVTDPNAQLSLAAGEYHVYTDKPLPIPDLTVVGLEDPNFTTASPQLTVFPNPVSDAIAMVRYHLDRRTQVSWQLYDLHGRVVLSQRAGYESIGTHEIDLDFLRPRTGHLHPPAKSRFCDAFASHHPSIAAAGVPPVAQHRPSDGRASGPLKGVLCTSRRGRGRPRRQRRLNCHGRDARGS